MRPWPEAGRAEKSKPKQIVFRLTVARWRGLGEHRRAQIWLSGARKARSEARRPPGIQREERPTGLLGAGFFQAFQKYRPSQGWRGR
jgi:hypothetical protein